MIDGAFGEFDDRKNNYLPTLNFRLVTSGDLEHVQQLFRSDYGKEEWRTMPYNKDGCCSKCDGKGFIENDMFDDIHDSRSFLVRPLILKCPRCRGYGFIRGLV